MSKQRAAALAAITAKLNRDDAEEDKAASAAIVVLIGDGLNSLDRIATALEKMAAPPALIQGEAISVGPIFNPELIAGIAESLERLADMHGRAKGPAGGIGHTED